MRFRELASCIEKKKKKKIEKQNLRVDHIGLVVSGEGHDIWKDCVA